MGRVSIAIDGPSGAGKSTISKTIAHSLGFVYVDTGAIYRTVGLYVKRVNLNPKDAKAVIPLLSNIKIDISYIGDTQTMILNGENVTSQIREHEISAYASDVSAISEVRMFLLEMQREFARKYNIIMDGRDIGTVVLPDATVKIFLTATPEDRAKRRYLELKEKGSEVSFEKVLNDVNARDAQDSSRATAPLKPAPDSVIIDTTGNTLDESIALIRGIIEERINNVAV